MYVCTHVMDYRCLMHVWFSLFSCDYLCYFACWHECQLLIVIKVFYVVLLVVSGESRVCLCVHVCGRCEVSLSVHFWLKLCRFTSFLDSHTTYLISCVACTFCEDMTCIIRCFNCVWSYLVGWQWCKACRWNRSHVSCRFSWFCVRCTGLCVFTYWQRIY